MTSDKKKVVDFEVQVPYGVSYLPPMSEKDEAENRLRLHAVECDSDPLPVPPVPENLSKGARTKSFKDVLLL